MSQPLQELLSLLQLEKLEEGLFRGQSRESRPTTGLWWSSIRTSAICGSLYRSRRPQCSLVPQLFSISW